MCTASNLVRLERVYNARKQRSRRKSQGTDDEKEEISEHRLTADSISRISHDSRPQSAPSQQSARRRRRITIPKPFQFEQRAKMQHTKPSISKRRFREYMDELQKEEEFHLNFEFKANAVPLSAVTTKMHGVHGLKGKTSKTANSTRSCTQNENGVFTAKKVPWFVKVKLYDAMKEEENTKRKERIKARADRLLSVSSLPPRMQLYETKENRTVRKMKIKEIKREHFKEYTFTPDINHIVPDFEREHEKFQKQLALRKQSKMPIKPEGFSFCDRDEEEQRRKQQETKPLDTATEETEEEQLQRKLEVTQRKIRAMIANPPKIIPKSTRKFDESVAMKRRKERKQERDAFVFEEGIRKKQIAIKAKWKGVLEKHLVDNSSTLEQKRLQSQREAAEAQRENAMHWKRQKKEMMKRVAERPLLVEEGRMKMERERAKKKALLLVHESLVNAGITNFSDFFDENELEQIQKIKQRSH